jgi:transglutaminase-like putative cysteine protease
MNGTPMLYDITISLTYTYVNAASASRHIMRLLPLDLPGTQRLIAGHVMADPKPDEWINHLDFFGNPSVELAFSDAQKEITFAAYARVERLEGGGQFDMSPPLGNLAGVIDACLWLDASAPHHFLGSSLRVPIMAETTDYARAILASTGTGMNALSVRDVVSLIGAAIHCDMRFDPEATSVETPMLEAFAGRHGVCQDFSHIMIACLRGLGIPAGYVSGCLRTIPPPGKARLEGADAMHAWVRAWCGPDMGWVEYDPTNATFTNADHITIARGRDYADVAPIKGIVRIAGSHSSTQKVDVVAV